MPRRHLWIALSVTLLVGLVVLLSAPVGEAHEAIPSTVQPKLHAKLVVLVVFDQMRGDYLDRWQPLFVKDGFKRLMDDGAWFKDCHYPYAFTVTAAGHASMATGCYPSTHGIVGNDWYDLA